MQIAKTSSLVNLCMFHGRFTRTILVLTCASTGWACSQDPSSLSTTTSPKLVELAPAEMPAPTVVPEQVATVDATTTTMPGPPHIKFAFSGDVLIHSQVYKRALNNTGGNGYDFTSRCLLRQREKTQVLSHFTEPHHQFLMQWRALATTVARQPVITHSTKAYLASSQRSPTLNALA